MYKNISNSRLCKIKKNLKNKNQQIKKNFKLQKHIEQLKPAKNKKTLVTLCGRFVLVEILAAGLISCPGGRIRIAVLLMPPQRRGLLAWPDLEKNCYNDQRCSNQRQTKFVWLCAFTLLLDVYSHNLKCIQQFLN